MLTQISQISRNSTPDVKSHGGFSIWWADMGLLWGEENTYFIHLNPIYTYLKQIIKIGDNGFLMDEIGVSFQEQSRYLCEI